MVSVRGEITEDIYLKNWLSSSLQLLKESTNQDSIEIVTIYDLPRTLGNSQSLGTLNHSLHDDFEIMTDKNQVFILKKS